MQLEQTEQTIREQQEFWENRLRQTLLVNSIRADENVLDFSRRRKHLMKSLSSPIPHISPPVIDHSENPIVPSSMTTSSTEHPSPISIPKPILLVTEESNRLDIQSNSPLESEILKNHRHLSSTMSIPSLETQNQIESDIHDHHFNSFNDSSSSKDTYVCSTIKTPSRPSSIEGVVIQSDNVPFSTEKSIITPKSIRSGKQLDSRTRRRTEIEIQSFLHENSSMNSLHSGNGSDSTKTITSSPSFPMKSSFSPGHNSIPSSSFPSPKSQTRPNRSHYSNTTDSDHSLVHDKRIQIEPMATTTTITQSPPQQQQPSLITKPIIPHHLQSSITHLGEGHHPANKPSTPHKGLLNISDNSHPTEEILPHLSSPIIEETIGDSIPRMTPNTDSRTLLQEYSSINPTSLLDSLEERFNRLHNRSHLLQNRVNEFSMKSSF